MASAMGYSWQRTKESKLVFNIQPKGITDGIKVFGCYLMCLSE